MVQIDVDLSQLHDLSEMTRDMKKRGMQLTAQDLLNNLMRTSPYRHGLLSSWFKAAESEDSITIKSPAYYARWVNDGHSQRPGRFIPGSWKGGEFEYNPKSKTGMVLKKSFVPGQHFVEKSMKATSSRIPEFFTING